MTHRYLIFHKPYGVLTQFTDNDNSSPNNSRPTLKDYIPVASVYPVGRLDLDSEGLLLLTNHGQLQHKLSDPRFQHSRTYWVQVENIPDDLAIAQLQTGVVIKGGYKTRPAKVRLLAEPPNLPPRHPPIRDRASIPTAWLEMTLTEGKNRQVRRMTASVGFPTLRLVRVAIAHLQLDDLALGQWRDLTHEELTPLLKLTGLSRQSSRYMF
jgi:23S rRNA pseudouridine2457 synthase